MSNVPVIVLCDNVLLFRRQRKTEKLLGELKNALLSSEKRMVAEIEEAGG